MAILDQSVGAVNVGGNEPEQAVCWRGQLSNAVSS